MYRLLVVCSLAACVCAAPFQGDPGDAAIIAEKRQLNSDGSIDVAYAQEDGVLFKETTNSDNERRGSWEYTGADNKKYRVEYEAGKGGFRILSSTHVDATPVQPLGSPEPEPEYRRQSEPEPEYRPQTRRNNVVSGNKFSIRYDLSQTAEPPRVSYESTYEPTTTRRPTTTTRTTTTTTTTPYPRRNYHTGEVSLDRNDKGYTYSYRHTG